MLQARAGPWPSSFLLTEPEAHAWKRRAIIGAAAGLAAILVPTLTQRGGGTPATLFILLVLAVTVVVIAVARILEDGRG